MSCEMWFKMQNEIKLFLRFYLEILGHAETLDLLSTEDGGHGLVGSEPLLVLNTSTWVHEYMSTWVHEYLNTWLQKEISIYLRVLQLVLLQIGPQTLGALKYFKKWNQRISWILNVNKIFPESHLRARNLLSLLSAEDLGEVVGDVEFFLNKRNVR